MFLNLNHFGVTRNLHWKLQSLQILYVNIVTVDWQIFMSPILLVIAKWIPNVRVCFDITSIHIGWFKWCNEKASKVIGIQQGNSQTNIKFQHVTSENPGKRVVQNQFNYKIKRTHHMGALSRAWRSIFTQDLRRVDQTMDLNNISFSFFWWPLWNINIFSLTAREWISHTSHYSNSIH